LRSLIRNERAVGVAVDDIRVAQDAGDKKLDDSSNQN
jgi:hypothetical protein